MPTYVFRNNATGEEWEESMSISASEEMMKENPDIVKVPSGISIIGGRGDGVKPTGDFKEVMSRISEQNPYSPLAAEYGKKDPTSVKVRETVKRVRKKVGGPMDD